MPSYAASHKFACTTRNAVQGRAAYPWRHTDMQQCISAINSINPPRPLGLRACRALKLKYHKNSPPHRFQSGCTKRPAGGSPDNTDFEHAFKTLLILTISPYVSHCIFDTLLSRMQKLHSRIRSVVKIRRGL